MNKYWFEPKKYGWGMVPNTMEGWIATLVLMIVLLIVVETNGIMDGSITTSSSLRVIFDLFIVGALFSLLMQGKVKGGLKWRMPKAKKTRKR